MLLKKNADYGGSAWKVPILAPHLSPGDAIRVRMSDKISRLIELSGKAGEVNESTLDTLLDLAGYVVLLRALPGTEAESDKAKVLAKYPGAYAKFDNDGDWRIEDGFGEMIHEEYWTTEAEAWADAVNWMEK